MAHTVWVVDDEPLNIQLLERIVERSGIGRVIGFTKEVAEVMKASLARCASSRVKARSS